MGKRTDSNAALGLTPSRVVVLIDASPDAHQALEAAAELARRHQVRLLAVSVEEPERSRIAGFPFAREVGAISGAIRPVDETLLGRRRERGSAAIRHAVERVSRAAEVSWELLVVRGRLVEEVLALSEPGDFLLLGRVGWSARLGRKLGRAPLMLARRATGTVHICSATPPRELGRIAVLVEDVETSRDMLAMAAARARAADRELVVLLAPLAREAVVDTLAGLMGNAPPKWRLRPLSALTTGEMLRALAEERAVELVAGRGGEWIASPAAVRILAHWRMPVLVTPESAG